MIDGAKLLSVAALLMLVHIQPHESVSVSKA